jgi:quinol monooxygenase YgiN
MIYTVQRFKIKPEWSDQFMNLLADASKATSEEEGCLWYVWSRNVDDPDEFILLDGFRDEAAVQFHLSTDYGKQALATVTPLLAEEPVYLFATVEGSESWNKFSDNPFSK